MPHYANGREAKVGDYVVGKCYNTPEIVSGRLLAVTPGYLTCNCTVGVVWDAALPVKTDFSQCDYLIHADDAHAAAVPAPGEKDVSAETTKP